MTRPTYPRDLDRFLEEAAKQARMSREDLLGQVLHLGRDHTAAFRQHMRPDIEALFDEFDYGVRTRNPGLHYAPRKSYLGYRRENYETAGPGERSQVFLSVLRNSTALDVVMPLGPNEVTHIACVRDLSSVGHHGVGDIRVTIEDACRLASFFTDFDFWLRPKTRGSD